MTNDLRPKQAAFVEEYLIDFNGTQAAIRAGYSPRTAAIIGFENLTKPKIVDALAQRRAEIAESKDITPEKVAAEYALMAFADIEDHTLWGHKRGALDSLCRMLGYNAPEKHDVRVAVLTLADIAKRRAEANVGDEMLQIATGLDNE